MNELVFRNEKNQPVTNSLLVAEKFGKEHRNVLSSIRDILMTAENPAVLSMFLESNYLNIQNKEQPMFVMNRDGFSLLVMGFNGKDAMKFKLEFIDEFNKMETLLNSDEYILMRSQEILNNRIKLLENENNRKDKLIEEKTKQLDESKEWFSIKRYAKIHKLNWRSINWRALKALSAENGYKVDKIFDSNYGKVNVYHIDIFNMYFSRIN